MKVVIVTVPEPAGNIYEKGVKERERGGRQID